MNNEVLLEAVNEDGNVMTLACDEDGKLIVTVEESE